MSESLKDQTKKVPQLDIRTYFSRSEVNINGTEVNSDRGQVREEEEEDSAVLSCTKVFYSNVLMITTLILSSGEMKAISQSRVWDKNIASQGVLMRQYICNFCDFKGSCNMFPKNLSSATPTSDLPLQFISVSSSLRFSFQVNQITEATPIYPTPNLAD